MKVSKILISGAAAISMMGAIGLTYAQSNTGDTTTGTPSTMERNSTGVGGTTGSTSTGNTPGTSGTMNSAGTTGSTTGSTTSTETGINRDTANTMNRDSTTGSMNRESMDTMRSSGQGSMTNGRMARADRN